MAARLIINADDFGLTPGINRAIAELFQANVLTSATLMATGRAFADAVSTAQSLPGLGVGCHVVLVDGSPVSPPSEIPTLLGPGGKTFRPTLGAFVRHLHLARISEDEIAHEALAQIQTLQRAGIDVTHVDTHKHTHLFPRVIRPLIAAMEKASVPALRNPFEPQFARNLKQAPLKRRLQMAILNRFQPYFESVTGQAVTTDGSIGVSATGSLDAQTLRQLLASLPAEGTFELVCHPGYNDDALSQVATRLRTHRDVERLALLAEIPKIFSLPQSLELIHYGDLSHSHQAAGARDA